MPHSTTGSSDVYTVVDNDRIARQHTCSLHNHHVQKAGIVLFRENKSELQALVVRSVSGQKKWSFPKGRCKSNEGSLLDTALRELWEETGLKSQDLRLLQLSFVDEGSGRTAAKKSRSMMTRYFVAVLAREMANKFQFDKSEISTCRWLSCSHVSTLLKPSRQQVLSAALRILEVADASNLPVPDICSLTQSVESLLIAPLAENASSSFLVKLPCSGIARAAQKPLLAKL